MKVTALAITPPSTAEDCPKITPELSSLNLPLSPPFCCLHSPLPPPQSNIGACDVWEKCRIISPSQLLALGPKNQFFDPSPWDQFFDPRWEELVIGSVLKDPKKYLLFNYY